MREGFLRLHRPGTPLLLANAWDQGSARLLASLGVKALATTSAGHAGTLGRLDGTVSRDEALAHAQAIAEATLLPVSADFENGFSDDPQGVADTVEMAAQRGLAGVSIEDYSRGDDARIYDCDVAVARVRAAAEVARRHDIVLTARAENHLHGRQDLDDTIARLRAFQDVGADVLYAPGLVELADIERLVRSVDRPVNVLCRPKGPSVAQLAALGVARISVGSAFFLVAVEAVAGAARAWLDEGSIDFCDTAVVGSKLFDVASELPWPE